MAFNWRLAFHLSVVLALADAGGRTLSPQESSQFLQLFRRYCANPSSSPSQDGNTFYYCKTSDAGPITLNLNHETEVEAGDTPKQVIFIQPPSYQYNHNVNLRGPPGNPQQTDIYVLPPTADHTLQLQDARSAASKPNKPALYFLSNNDQQGPSPVAAGGGASSNTGFSPRANNPTPSSPNVIGIPSDNEGYSSGSAVGFRSGGQQQAYGAPLQAGRGNQRNLRGASHYSKYSNL